MFHKELESSVEGLSNWFYEYFDMIAYPIPYQFRNMNPLHLSAYKYIQSCMDDDGNIDYGYFNTLLEEAKAISGNCFVKLACIDCILSTKIAASYFQFLKKTDPKLKKLKLAELSIIDESQDAIHTVLLISNFHLYSMKDIAQDKFLCWLNERKEQYILIDLTQAYSRCGSPVVDKIWSRDVFQQPILQYRDMVIASANATFSLKKIYGSEFERLAIKSSCTIL